MSASAPAASGVRPSPGPGDSPVPGQLLAVADLIRRQALCQTFTELVRVARRLAPDLRAVELLRLTGQRLPGSPAAAPETGSPGITEPSTPERANSWGDRTRGRIEGDGCRGREVGRHRDPAPAPGHPRGQGPAPSRLGRPPLTAHSYWLGCGSSRGGKTATWLGGRASASSLSDPENARDRLTRSSTPTRSPVNSRPLCTVHVGARSGEKARQHPWAQRHPRLMDPANGRRCRSLLHPSRPDP